MNEVDEDSPDGETESGSVFSPTADEIEIEEEEDEEGYESAVVEEEDAEDLDDIVEGPNFTWNEYIDLSAELEGLPPQWPTFEVVNLDRRLPVKFKRHDYEPLANPMLINLSNTFQDASSVFHETSKSCRTQDFTWSESEKEVYLPYILHYGPNSREMYEHLLGIISKQYLETPTTPITLEDLRKLSPDTPLLFLVSLQTLMMNLQVINSKNSYQSTENITGHRYNFGNSYFKHGVFSCLTCLRDCSVARYESQRDRFVVCVDCFDCGKYPSWMISSDFRFKVKYLTSSSSESTNSSKWSPKEILDLLEGVEKYDCDWGQISAHIGRSENDCMHKFASLPTLMAPKIPKESSMENLLKELVGETTNPSISLVNMLLNCVHPSLGAEAAKSCLHSLCKSSTNLIESDDNWAAAVGGLKAAIMRAKELVTQEEMVLEGLHNDLIQFQAELLGND